MCIVLCPDKKDQYVNSVHKLELVFFLSRSLVSPRHRCVIIHEVGDESLRKICQYQQNVLQHYCLLDTLVLLISISVYG